MIALIYLSTLQYWKILVENTIDSSEQTFLELDYYSWAGNQHLFVGEDWQVPLVQRTCWGNLNRYSVGMLLCPYHAMYK